MNANEGSIMVKTFTSTINRIGLQYIAHFDEIRVKVTGYNWYVCIPLSRVSEFCNLFPEMNWEDGEYIEQLRGHEVVIQADDFQILTLLSTNVHGVCYNVNSTKEGKYNGS